MVTTPTMCRPQLEACSDEELAELATNGDNEAFSILFARHEPAFSRVAGSIVKHDADAQDVVQTAFLNMVRKLHTYHGGGAFAGWAYRIVRNAALMHLRRRRRLNEVSFEPTRARRATSYTPHSALNDQQIREVVASLAERLEPKYRRAFELRDLEHRSMEELGNELGLSVGGAKTRLHRARGQLRVWLEDEYGLTPS